MKSFEIINTITSHLDENGSRHSIKPEMRDDNVFFWSEVIPYVLVTVADNYEDSSLDVTIGDDVFKFKTGRDNAEHKEILDNVVSKIKEFRSR